MSEHAVIVNFVYGNNDLSPLFQLEEKLEQVIDLNQVGEYDGNEIAVGGTNGIMYMYGPDADRLFSVIKPILESAPFMRGATATLRYGPPENGVRETKVSIIS